jgi:hypothetical protein
MAKSKARTIASPGEEVTSKFKTYTIPGVEKPVAVERAVNMGKATHYYYVDPRDKKEKRVIVLHKD